MRWLSLSRWPGWASSKLPYLAAAALLLLRDPSPALILAIVGTVACSAAFGYAANEVADRRSDERAGKPNRAAALPTRSWAAFLVLTAVGSVALSLTWAEDAATPILVAVALALALGYSFPPLRLKERGRLGLLAAAAAQWGLPVLAVAGAEPGGWTRPAALAMCALSLVVGVRWMAVHQLADARADRRGGVTTYVSAGGDATTVLRRALAMEGILLAATLALAWPRSLPAVAALLLWAIWALASRSRREPLGVRIVDYVDPPLAGYYFFLLPVAMAVAAAPPVPGWLAVAALLAVLGASRLDRMAFGGRGGRLLANLARG
jgi:4-hydroxybenzoate polyprenyltransferase